MGTLFIFIYYYFLNPHPRICLLTLEREEGRGRERETRRGRERGRGKERERERERNIIWETSIVCIPYVPRRGIKHTTSVCALTGNQTRSLLVYGMTLQPAEAPGQGYRHFKSEVFHLSFISKKSSPLFTHMFFLFICIFLSGTSNMSSHLLLHAVYLSHFFEGVNFPNLTFWFTNSSATLFPFNINFSFYSFHIFILGSLMFSWVYFTSLTFTLKNSPSLYLR